jgi:predicted nucleic acid-binding protein
VPGAVPKAVVVAGAFKEVDKVPDDAKDKPLVEAALEGAAEAIVSDDVDLLSLKVVKVRGFRPVQMSSNSESGVAQSQ